MFLTIPLQSFLLLLKEKASILELISVLYFSGPFRHSTIVLTKERGVTAINNARKVVWGDVTNTRLPETARFVRTDYLMKPHQEGYYNRPTREAYNDLAREKATKEFAKFSKGYKYRNVITDHKCGVIENTDGSLSARLVMTSKPTFLNERMEKREAISLNKHESWAGRNIPTYIASFPDSYENLDPKNFKQDERTTSFYKKSLDKNPVAEKEINKELNRQDRRVVHTVPDNRPFNRITSRENVKYKNNNENDSY